MQFTALFITGLLRLFLLMPVIFFSRHSLMHDYKKLLFVFCLLFLFDTIVFGLLLFDGQHWNWAGNIGRLLWMMLFIGTTKRITKQDIGWSLIINDRKSVFIIVGLLVFLRLTLRFIFQGFTADYNLETFCYESTLPGISEEILFRGIFLGLLNKAYKPQWRFLKTTFGWGLILTSILFGLIHGLTLNTDWIPDFNSQRFLMTAALGFAFGFIKEKSGSLVPGIIAHNLWNIIAYWGK